MLKAWNYTGASPIVKFFFWKAINREGSGSGKRQNVARKCGVRKYLWYNPINHCGRWTLVKDKRGFTLIELLITVAIVAVLAAIAIPQFSAYRVKAYNASAESDLRNFRTHMEAAMADTRVYPHL